MKMEVCEVILVVIMLACVLITAVWRVKSTSLNERIEELDAGQEKDKLIEEKDSIEKKQAILGGLLVVMLFVSLLSIGY